MAVYKFKLGCLIGNFGQELTNLTDACASHFCQLC